MIMIEIHYRGGSGKGGGLKRVICNLPFWQTPNITWSVTQSVNEECTSQAEVMSNSEKIKAVALAIVELRESEFKTVS